MQKKILIALLIVGLLSIGGQVFAAQPEEAITVPASTRYTVFIVLYPTLSVSGTTASYSLSITCAPEVTSIVATLQIQKLTNGVYSNYSSPWTASSSNNRLSTSGTKTVESGGTYRLKVTATAYYPGGSETVTVYS